MSSLIIGFISFALVIVFSAEKSLSSYLQWHSFLIVAGGTVAVLLLSTPKNVLKSLGIHLKGLFVPDDAFEHHMDDLLILSKNRNTAVSSNNILLKYSVELWSQGIDPDLFIVLLAQKRREMEFKGTDAVHALKNLSKYPPALGMIGTVMGMVALFAVLDSQKGNIGLHLSLAMTATLLGLVLTNALISPLADRLHVKHVQNQRILDAVYEILLLINRGEPSSLIQEELHVRAA